MPQKAPRSRHKECTGRHEHCGQDPTSGDLLRVLNGDKMGSYEIIVDTFDPNESKSGLFMSI